MLEEFLFWLSGLCLFHVYLGYPLLLALFRSLAGPRPPAPAPPTDPPMVSVIIAAWNEERSIVARVENCLALDYPSSRMEIIVASDGSRDGTVAKAQSFADRGVRVLGFTTNRGKAVVHNDAVSAARGDILVFTDADTVFEKDFISQTVARFADPKVGCVVGKLVYRSTGSSIAEAESLYWKMERAIRSLESDLGILATATGACMAVRKELWRQLTPIDDSDFTTPLDVILQGQMVVYEPGAVACDEPVSSMGGEIRMRTRQVSKNLVGTLRRWGWKGWLRHPLVSAGLVSHKLLRWMTGFFMLAVLGANIALWGRHPFYSGTLVLQVLFHLVGLAGLLAAFHGRRIPVASTVSSFLVGALGMGMGVVKGLAGKAPRSFVAAEARPGQPRRG